MSRLHVVLVVLPTLPTCASSIDIFSSWVYTFRSFQVAVDNVSAMLQPWLKGHRASRHLWFYSVCCREVCVALEYTRSDYHVDCSRLSSFGASLWKPHVRTEGQHECVGVALRFKLVCVARAERVSEYCSDDVWRGDGIALRTFPVRRLLRCGRSRVARVSYRPHSSKVARVWGGGCAHCVC